VQVESILIPDDLFLDARAGDPAAISALWDTCTPAIKQALRWNRPTLGGTVDRADVAQEAARIFLEALRGDECTTSAALLQFLIRKLPNRLSTYLRAERRRLGRQVLADETEIETALARGRTATRPSGPSGRRIARALERLSPRQRAVITGLYFRELKVGELTRELGVSQQAIDALRQRAFATLRKALEEQEDSPEQPNDC